MMKMFFNTIVPKTAVLELTYQCNHRCEFCSVPWENPSGAYGRGNELSAEDWKHCINMLADKGVRTIAFSGGEPLMKEDFKEIFAYASAATVQEPVFDDAGLHTGFRAIPLETSVITNGGLVDERHIEIFAHYKPILTVSLPGLSTYSEHTGGGDHAKALRAIKRFSKAGLNVVVSICVTKKNLPELFETIARGFLSGASQLLLNRFLPGGRGIEHTELCLTKEEVLLMLDTAEEACEAAGSYGSIGTELPKCILTKDYPMLTVGTKCSGGIDFFAIDPSGRVRPCNHSPVQLGTIDDIESAIASPYWQRFKTRDFLPAHCAPCPQALHCDGGCREAAHITSGALDSPDPLFQAAQNTS